MLNPGVVLWQGFLGYLGIPAVNFATCYADDGVYDVTLVEDRINETNILNRIGVTATTCTAYGQDGQGVNTNSTLSILTPSEAAGCRADLRALTAGVQVCP